MANNSDETENNCEIPSWIQASLFEPVLKEIIGGYRQIKDFKTKKVLGGGEIFATILRIEVEVELNDGSSKSISLILKYALENEKFQEIMQSHNVVEAEAAMYRDVILDFEKIYKNAGLEVKFSPKSYTLDTEHNYILLEDLKPKGFINVNRLEGLDMEHTQAVLKKLAQWHAVSAVRVATKGLYPPVISLGFFKEDNLPIIKNILAAEVDMKLKCLKNFSGSELYYEKLLEQKDCQLDRLFRASKVDPNDFNVLNHGDCWSNNVMFKHDAFGKIKETCLIDFQMPRYGTPAQDLYNLILSSTNYELKIKHFDYFIKYYYNELSEHLKLLNYNRKMPTLKDIHIMLHKYNVWGLATVNGLMAAVLHDPQEEIDLDNELSEPDVATKLQIQMYSNPRYRKQCEMLYPWLYYRGAI